MKDLTPEQEFVAAALPIERLVDILIDAVRKDRWEVVNVLRKELIKRGGTK